MPAFVVVSGAPASGKTTVAAVLADLLGLAHLDKDAFLEALFGEETVVSLAHRAALSREADDRLFSEAQRHERAVLSSWWRHPQSRRDSGTQTSWLRQSPVVEVHCRCAAGTALTRFTARRRHPGHLDELRSMAALRQQFDEAERLGPLFPDVALSLDTEQPLSAFAARDLAAAVRARLADLARPRAG